MKKLPHLRLLEGNPGRRPIPPLGVEADGAPEAPSHLSYEAHACFETIRRSMPPGVYKALDTFLISAFAEAWAIHKVCAVEINQPGFHFVSSDRPSAWLSLMTKQAMLMVSLGARLGLDPISRASIDPPAERKPSKFDGLIRDRGDLRD